MKFLQLNVPEDWTDEDIESYLQSMQSILDQGKKMVVIGVPGEWGESQLATFSKMVTFLRAEVDEAVE